MNTSMAAKTAITLIASALFLSACATKPADPTPADVVGGLKSTDAKSEECVAASIVGGIIGSMVADSKDTAKGVAAGAGIGMLGCLAVKANARDKQAGSPAAAASAAPATPASAAK